MSERFHGTPRLATCRKHNPAEAAANYGAPVTLDAPTIISSLLALVILGALVLLVRSMARNTEIEITTDYLFSGTPTEAADSLSRALDGIKGIELRPATPYDVLLVRRVVPTWCYLFLLLGAIPGIVLSLACRHDLFNRAYLTPGPGNRPMLRLSGRFTKPQAAELEQRLRSVAVRL
jgi:hypothetical protein